MTSTTDVTYVVSRVLVSIGRAGAPGVVRLDADERAGSGTIRVSHDGVVVGTLSSIVEALSFLAHAGWPEGLVFDLRLVAVVDGSGAGPVPDHLTGTADLPVARRSRPH